MKRYYVGCKGGRREVFTAEKKPTEQSHGSRYNAVIGPFQTKKGAEFMAQQGGSNPHIQTVADAERAVKSQKRKKLPGYSSEIKGCRKIGWRERVPSGWEVVKEGTYYKHIRPKR